MLKFIIKRFAIAIPTLLVLITISFFLMQTAPGSPFTGERNLPPEILKNIEAKYNLDKPVWQQYLYYLRDLSQGDLGPSFKYRDYTVNDLLEQSFPVSLKIGGIAFVFTVLAGISIGTIAALKQNTFLDYFIMALAMTGIVLPSFVIAPLLVLIFSISLQWLPAGGWNGGTWQHMILPVTAMAILYMASIARIQRGSMIEVLNSNFIRTARAKGLPWRRIVFAMPCAHPCCRHLLSWPCLCRHYYRLRRRGNGVWIARYWPAFCQWCSQSRLLTGLGSDHYYRALTILFTPLSIFSTR